MKNDNILHFVPRHLIADPEDVKSLLGVKRCQRGHPNRDMVRTFANGRVSKRGTWLKCPCGVSFNARFYRAMAARVDANLARLEGK
jgi:hypothetical protein